MGDIADMMINGDLDEQTGEYIGPGQGFPRSKYGMDYGKDVKTVITVLPYDTSNGDKYLALSKLLGYEVQIYNKGYQLRAIKGGKRFDYFPTTHKGNWVGTKKFFHLESTIETFMFNNFKD